MKKLLCLLTGITFSVVINAQSVGIGTVSPDNSSQLEINSTTKGVLVPRMTSTQIAAIVSPAAALMVYQTNGIPGFYYNAGNAGSPVWKRVGDEADFSGSNQPYYSPTNTNFIVPAGVYRINFEMTGGGAGAGGTYLNGASSFGGGGGGGGGFAKGYINVTPGENLTIVVGDRGVSGANGTPGSNGTDGSLSRISSGATTLITVSGGSKGLAGSVSAMGNGGNGGSITVLDSRAKLNCTIWSSNGGLSGYGGNGVLSLTGEAGVVHSMGLYNRSIYTSSFSGSGGTVVTLKPYYGIGAGYGSSPPIWGYMVLYW